MASIENLEIFAEPQELVRINRRRRINVRRAGSGAPTVIFSPVLHFGTLHWARVQPAIAERTSTLSWDLPGFGFSDPGPLPRAPARDLDDLRVALKALALPSPYVLVAHSAGVFDARAFANLHTQEIAGMVLADPSFAPRDRGRLEAANPAVTGNMERDQERLAHCARCARANGLTPGSEAFKRCIAYSLNPGFPGTLNDAIRDWSLRPATWRARLSENKARHLSTAETPQTAHRHWGDMPVIVLSAGNWPGPRTPERIRWLAELHAIHAELAALSSRSEYRVVADCGHDIPWEKPQAIASAIDNILDRIDAGHRKRTS